MSLRQTFEPFTALSSQRLYSPTTRWAMKNGPGAYTLIPTPPPGSVKHQENSTSLNGSPPADIDSDQQLVSRVNDAAPISIGSIIEVSIHKARSVGPRNRIKGPTQPAIATTINRARTRSVKCRVMMHKVA